MHTYSLSKLTYFRLNTSVLLHKPISWEWGPVIVSLVLFVAFMELYKYAKRHWFSDSFFAAEYNHNLEYSKNDDPVEMVVIPDPVKSQRV